MYLELDDEETASAYIAIIDFDRLPEGVENKEEDEVVIGRRYRLFEGKELLIGFGIEADIQLPRYFCSEHHAKLFYQQGQWYVRNLSDDKTTYNLFDMIVGLHPLKRDGETFKVGKVGFKYFDGDGSESRFDKKNYARSRIDAMTKAYNRKYIFEKVEDELSWFSRPAARQLSLLMFDVDHFKVLNDTHGHLCGDKVLKSVCNRIQQRLRKHEKIGRYGGEEFVVVMPESGHEKAVKLAEEIRLLVASEPVEYKTKKIPVTISIGLAWVEKSEGQDSTVPDVESFIEAADKKVYEAKRTGRNKVCF